MPKGKGTYGSQVGRPSTKKTKPKGKRLWEWLTILETLLGQMTFK